MILRRLGRTHHVPHVWAYMLLGQVVAISVASNLFCLSLVLLTSSKDQRHDETRTPKSPPAILWFSVLVALITVTRSPQTTDKTFLLNLLTMHATIVLPLVLPMSRGPYETQTMYAVVGGISATLHTQTTLHAFVALPRDARSLLGFAKSAWTTIHSHPAQSSITWDVIWTFISFGIWVYLSPLDQAREVEGSEVANLSYDKHS